MIYYDCHKRSILFVQIKLKLIFDDTVTLTPILFQQYNQQSNRRILVAQVRAAPMPFVRNATEPVHVLVLKITSVIHTVAVDRNAFKILNVIVRGHV